MIDLEEIPVSLSSGGEDPGKEPAESVTEVEDEIGKREAQNNCVTRLRSSLQVVLIVILGVLLCGVAGALIAQLNKQQSLTAELQHMAHNTKKLQMKITELQQLLNSTHQNFTPLGSECGQLKLLVNTTRYNLTLLSAENTQLGLLLKNISQEKSQLQVLNKELNTALNSTSEYCDLVEDENRKLNLLLNESLDIITMVSAESKQLRLHLNKEQQTSKQLEAENKHQRSILLSDRLSFLWRFCDKDTLQCSRCLPGWVEHASRCFFLSQETEKWEKARKICLDLGGDLAVVLNAKDQAFLTNMTFQFKQQHPEVLFHSAWIGLQDMVKEGTHIWVNGNRIHRNVIYWKPMEPNNAMASWDTSQAGQDCVAIVPPSKIGEKNWLKSWDDIVCGGKRHFLCETMALNLT
ncbi:low affinity immunoglobulin epsilon Fc receptor-like [Plectropomus leopardus]|uniref:low affinity immunoglobulin epsilon Fc receptor-like n=1 Tax=Plectropomus leopardus TaxID=160734 RepID=UPI001C4DA70D|nr:low affinity immunoglobulin epsilon Fc receptor-like [Plectropomus leopardus]